MQTHIYIYTEIKKENFPYVDKLLGANSDTIWNNIEALAFREKTIHVKTNDSALVQLLYLASFKDTYSKSPFTEKECKVLKSSSGWDTAASWSLPVCLLINSLLFVGLAFNPLISTAAQNQTGNNETDLQESKFTPGLNGLIALSSTLGVLTNAISFWATGFAPHWTSNAANSKQDTLDNVKDHYLDLSGRLLRLYFSEAQDEAEKIAYNINIKELKKCCLHETQNKEKTKAILAPLKQTLLFIKTKGQIFPSNISLTTLIENTKRKN